MVQMLDWQKLSQQERALATFVQGILNRKGKKIFIDIDNYKLFLKEKAEETDLWTLLEANVGEFEGAVSYKLDCDYFRGYRFARRALRTHCKGKRAGA